ncbi:MAG: hypothetical protein PHU25_21785 [Deltaproteobacteria bacterium]|nr:hypothetical protein [Deltaproteobacteria bacterium]
MRKSTKPSMAQGARLAKIAVLAVAALSSSAAAEDRPGVVMIAPGKADAVSEDASAAVKGQLSDLPVSFQVVRIDSWPPDLPSQIGLARSVARDTRASTVFWVDLSVPDQVFLYLSEPGGGRTLVRNIESRGERTEGRVEAMAVIVRTAVTALLEGGEIGVHAPPPPPPEPERPGMLEASVSYGLSFYSDEALLVHGARIGASVLPAEWARLFAAYRIEVPFRIENEQVAMDISPHPLEIGFAIRWRYGSVTLDGGAAFLSDWITWSASPKSDDVLATSPKSRWRGGISPFVLLGWSPVVFSMFYISVSIDALINEKKYVVRAGGGDIEVADPWSARPYFQAGVALSML